MVVAMVGETEGGAMAEASAEETEAVDSEAAVLVERVAAVVVAPMVAGEQEVEMGVAGMVRQTILPRSTLHKERLECRRDTCR